MTEKKYSKKLKQSRKLDYFYNTIMKKYLLKKNIIKQYKTNYKLNTENNNATITKNLIPYLAINGSWSLQEKK